MRRLVPVLVLSALCLPMPAQAIGKIVGKVLNKEGNPIVGAKVLLKRSDRNWTKELITDKDGGFLQIGLDPVMYDITVSAEGFVTQTYQNEKIPMSDALRKDFTLLTPQQAKAEGGATKVVPQDPGALADMQGRDAFNQIIPLYNQQKYSEALPGVEESYKKLNEALATTKDEQTKTEITALLPQVERVYGICLALGSKDRKAEAEPILTKVVAANPKDQGALAGLLEVAKAKGDKAAQAKYQAALDEINGPNPDVVYNKAVNAFNGGHMKEAKTELENVLKIDEKYANAYYLLGLVEANASNFKGAKLNLQKYIDLAPTGKHAAEVKAMLGELKHMK